MRESALGKIRSGPRVILHAKASSYGRGLLRWSKTRPARGAAKLGPPTETLMSYVLGLKCKECGHRVPVSPVHVCEQCFGPYEVEYDYAKMKGNVTRESIA